MKILIFTLLLLSLALPWPGAAHAACTTQTYVLNGRIVYCTTCCMGGSCTTNCNG